MLRRGERAVKNIGDIFISKYQLQFIYLEVFAKFNNFVFNEDC